MCVSICHLCLTLWHPADCSLPDSSVHEIFQVRMLEWVAIYFLLQGVFPTQGSNPHLLHLLINRQILYNWCHLGSPNEDEYTLNLMSSFHFWVWIILTTCSYYIWISDWGFKRYSYFGRALELLCLFPHIQIVKTFVFWENCWYKHTDLVFLVGVTVLWSLKPWRIPEAWAPNWSTSEWRMGGNVATCVSWFGGAHPTSLWDGMECSCCPWPHCKSLSRCPSPLLLTEQVKHRTWRKSRQHLVLCGQQSSGLTHGLVLPQQGSWGDRVQPHLRDWVEDDAVPWQRLIPCDVSRTRTLCPHKGSSKQPKDWVYFASTGDGAISVLHNLHQRES